MGVDLVIAAGGTPRRLRPVVNVLADWWVGWWVDSCFDWFVYVLAIWYADIHCGLVIDELVSLHVRTRDGDQSWVIPPTHATLLYQRAEDPFRCHTSTAHT